MLNRMKTCKVSYIMSLLFTLVLLSSVSVNFVIPATLSPCFRFHSSNLQIDSIKNNLVDNISKRFLRTVKLIYLNSVRVYSEKFDGEVSSTTNYFASISKCEQSFKVHKPSHLNTLLSETTSKLLLDGGSTSVKRVLILISDTGGGHRASAQAIDQAIHQTHRGKVDVSILDIWTDYAKYPFNQFVPTYRFLAKHPLLWRGFYAYGAFPPTKLLTEVWSRALCYKSFRDAVIERDPDLVVSMHPLCQLMPLSIVAEMNKERKSTKKSIPFVTIVTDLGGAHATWFDRRADVVFVPSKEVKDIALKYGIPSDRILIKGLPIRPVFWRPPPAKQEIRKKLGLLENAKTVLVMGGGDGVGKLQQIALEIGSKLADFKDSTQMIVICGHNQVIADSLKARKWANNINVAVKGFVSNIDEFMAASDCLVTKAGPGTIAEAMTRGLPLVLSSYLPGQEAGNVPYVVNRKFGLYTGLNPKKIARTVHHLCSNEQKLTEMSKRALNFSSPKATQEIADVIHSLLFSKLD